MQVLRFATRTQIESIFEENHALWGLPLTPEQYRDYWFSLFLTPWGCSNLRYMALTEEEDGPLLSSLKLYRFTGRLHDTPVVIAGIGAVYTPKAQRTFGSASLLVGEVLDYMQKKHAGLALLYSDIGVAFYERLGFSVLPATVTSGALAPAATPAPRRDLGGIEIREAVISDSKLLAPFHHQLTEGWPFVIDREASYWEFLLYRRRRFWELAPPSEGKPVTLVALRGGRIVASGFAAASPQGLRLQEATALAGEEEALRAILDRIWDAGLEAGAVEWRSSLPPDAAALDSRLAGQTRPVQQAIPMVAPLGTTRNLAALGSDPALRHLGLDPI